jgi:hypothetical protein
MKKFINAIHIITILIVLTAQAILSQSALQES